MLRKLVSISLLFLNSCYWWEISQLYQVIIHEWSSSFACVSPNAGVSYLWEHLSRCILCCVSRWLGRRMTYDIQSCFHPYMLYLLMVDQKWCKWENSLYYGQPLPSFIPRLAGGEVCRYNMCVRPQSSHDCLMASECDLYIVFLSHLCIFILILW